MGRGASARCLPARLSGAEDAQAPLVKGTSVVPMINGDGCEISVPAQTTNSVDYVTNGNNILIEPLVKNIKYTENSGCSAEGAGTLANGTYGRPSGSDDRERNSELHAIAL